MKTDPNAKLLRIRTENGWRYVKKVGSVGEEAILAIDDQGFLIKVEIDGLVVEEQIIGPRGGKQWQSLVPAVTN